MLRHYLRKTAYRLTQIAYAKRNYKLLMNASFRELNSRTQALAAATNFFSTIVRPIAVQAPFGNSMLVIAPHQDDEVIGCGGAMALQKKAGATVQSVVLQDGSDEHEKMSLTREHLSKLRNSESCAAARVIGAEPPVFLSHKSLAREEAQITASLIHLIKQKHVDVVFTPFALDGNIDHRTTSRILAGALSQISRNIRVFQYEVWANCIPNVVVIIDTVMAQKVEMLRCFKFANSAFDYTHATTGLNMYHSRMLPVGVARYVEAYFEAPREEYIDIIGSIKVAELAK